MLKIIDDNLYFKHIFCFNLKEKCEWRNLKMKNKNKVVSYIVTAIVGIGVGSISTIAIERLPDKNTSKYQVSSLFYRQTTPKETPILKSLVEPL